MRGYRTFAKRVRLQADLHLQLQGFTYTAYSDATDMVIFRKVLKSWYLFVIWDYLAHLRTKDLETYNINLLRVAVDQPYGQYIRDKKGVYIPGSLVNSIFPPGSSIWEYGSVEQLDEQVSQALQIIDEHLPWLENQDSTMGYTI